MKMKNSSLANKLVFLAIILACLIVSKVDSFSSNDDDDLAEIFYRNVEALLYICSNIDKIDYEELAISKDSLILICLSEGFIDQHSAMSSRFNRMRRKLRLHPSFIYSDMLKEKNKNKKLN